MAEDPLYAELYGAAAPFVEKEAPKTAPGFIPPPASPLAARPSAATSRQFSWSRQHQTAPETAGAEEVGVAEEQSSDEELDVRLDVPAEEEDDLDVNLDESLQTAFLERPQVDASNASSGGLFGGAGPSMAPRPPGDTSYLGVPPPRPPPGAPPAGTPAAHVLAGPAAHAFPQIPGQQKNQLIDLPPALPQQAQAGQKIRLPGQSRVAPEEYREFLVLGHGGVFDLEVDNVVEAPWKVPGADPRDFFNYGLNMASWREYCRRVHHFRSEFALQKKIQTYEGTAHHASTSDLPPELAAAVAAEAEAEMAARAATPTMTLHRPSGRSQQAQIAHGHSNAAAAPASHPLMLQANGSSALGQQRSHAPIVREAVVHKADAQRPLSTSSPAGLGQEAGGQVLHKATNGHAGALESATMPSLPMPDSATSQKEPTAGQHSVGLPMPSQFPSLMEDGTFGSIMDLNDADPWRQAKRQRTESGRAASLLGTPGMQSAINRQH